MTDTQETDPEVAAIATISAALGRLGDAEARQRVISYVLARYLPASSAGVVATRPTLPATSAHPVAGPPGVRELPGIARLTESGELHLTVRDLKARSGLDAAARLAYVAIYAFQQLAHQPLSSSKGLTPLLKTWRIYDGNTRRRLSIDKGILRNGDELSLDAHATRDAERIVEEILDPSVEGRWKAK